MQKCDNCNVKFDYGLLFKSFWLAFKPIKCQNCGTRHEVTNAGRFRFLLLTIVPFLIVFNFVINTDNGFLIFSTGVLIIIIVSFIYPFVTPYKKDEFYRNGTKHK